jgi:hypothetical protein
MLATLHVIHLAWGKFSGFVGSKTTVVGESVKPFWIRCWSTRAWVSSLGVAGDVLAHETQLPDVLFVMSIKNACNLATGKRVKSGQTKDTILIEKGS